MLRSKYLTDYIKRNVALFTARGYSSKSIPSEAEIVIAGGGTIGSSIAYHLAKLGWKDIALLEQGSPGCGTSWHAAGLVGTLRLPKEVSSNILYGQSLFEEFENEYGIGFKRCGSLSLAQTEDRALSLRRLESSVKSNGGECYLLSPEEAKRINPHINIDDVKLAIIAPNDGVVDPTNLIQAYLKGAKSNGHTEVHAGVQVQEVKTDKNRVVSVKTNQGEIKCDHFINAAGLWARELGQKSSPAVEVPLHACQHFMIVSKPLGINDMMPVTRDYDSNIYIREWSGGIMAGGFELKPLSCFEDQVPEKFEFQLLEENWEQFNPLLDGILNRLPVMEDAEIRSFVNGPESFTPDGFPNLSQSTTIDNYYIAAGLNSFGIAFSPAAGRYIAELVTHGKSEQLSPHNIDVRRLQPGSNNKIYCRDKAIDTLANSYELHYPHQTLSSCPNLKISPLHSLLEQNGAVWKQYMDWETPIFFSSEGKFAPTFGKPDWLKTVQAEIRTCKNAIGIVDRSSQSVFRIETSTHTSIEDFLTKVIPDSGLAHLLKNEGGIYNGPIVDGNGDCIATASVIRESDNSLTFITDACNHMFLLSTLKKQTCINIDDKTGNYSIISLIGPQVKNLLKDLMSPQYQDVIDEDFTSCKILDIGYASKVMVFPNDIGEGCTLLVPAQYSQGIYQSLMVCGEDYGIKNVGQIALESLRVQSKVPHIPNEIAFENYTDVAKSIKLLKVSVLNQNNWPWGGEPIRLSSTKDLIGEVQTIGYDENNENIVYLLSRLDSDVGDENIMVEVAGEFYPGEIIY